jgi:phage repressor protein C with HTH and peptisase S24 domain
MSLGEILKKRRKEMDLTLDEVSAKVGFSKPYLSTIETGRVTNPPSDELLTKLERVLKFNTGELLLTAHMERMSTDVREKFERAIAENEKLRGIVKDVLASGDGDKLKQLEQMIKQGPGSPEGTGNVETTISPGRLVPIINRVQAGYPADFDDLDYPVGVADDYVRCPDLHDPQAFAVRVVGDSMEPNFKEGDIVIFSPQVEVKSGDDCFIRFAEPHETAFKRVFLDENNVVRLQPRNDKYAPVMVEGKRINGMYRAIAKYEKL